MNKLDDKKTSNDHICRCFSPPPDTKFVKGSLYEWEFHTYGITVINSSGDKWTGSIIEFGCRFQIVSGM